jgi:hypothetical protein
MTCAYLTSLGRECGREATSGQHCDFHAVLAEFDAYARDERDVIIVLESARPLVDRILSDVQVNCDTMPHRQLLGLPYNPDDYRPLTREEIREQAELTREVLES